MDAVRHTFPVKRLLALSLAVLLVHLGTLRSLSIGLGQLPQLVNAPRTFTTRAVTPAIGAPAAPTPPKPKPMPVRAAVQKAPVPPTALILAAATAQATSDIATEPEPQAAAADAAATPASAPASASAPAAPPAAAPADTAATSPASEPAAPVGAALDDPLLSAQLKPLNASSEALSGSTRLLYTVKTSKFPLTLNGELLWLYQGSSYSARLRYSGFGQTRMQTSRGQITDRGLAPERFADKYRSEVAAHFNYTESKITFSANTPEARLLPGAQDRLSVLIQLGAVIATDPRSYPDGTTLMLQTVGPRAADLWLFTVGSLEQLVLPGGTLLGLKLERQPRDLYDQKVEVWLSPQLSYLPARIRITETNGDNIDQQWSGTASADASDKTN